MCVFMPSPAYSLAQGERTKIFTCGGILYALLTDAGLGSYRVVAGSCQPAASMPSERAPVTNVACDVAVGRHGYIDAMVWRLHPRHLHDHL